MPNDKKPPPASTDAKRPMPERHYDDTITGVTSLVWDTINALRADTIDRQRAGELHNGAGKIIKARSAQLEYFSMMKEKHRITFWYEPDGSPRATAGGKEST